MSATLANTPWNGCTWPVGELDGQHLFCGSDRAARGVPYCEQHMRRAFPGARKVNRTPQRMAQIREAIARREQGATIMPDAYTSPADRASSAGPVLSVVPCAGLSDVKSAEPDVKSPLRAVEPICINGIAPHEPPTGEPILDWVNPGDLVVEEDYQRDLSPKSINLIRKIVAEWDWRKFKPPVVALAEGGFRIIDGQHTAIAAASHPAIHRIPVMVVDAAELQARAAAFIGHNRDRLQVTPMQLHHAAVAAGQDLAVTVEQVCERAGVKLVRSAYGSRQWTVGETQAINAVRSLVDRQGAQKSRQILSALVLANLAPIAAHHVKAAEMLFTGADYAEQLEPLSENGPADVATAIKALAETADKEARVFAAANCVPYWRALGVVWFRKSRKRRKPAAAAVAA